MKTKLLFIAIIATFSLFSQIPSYVPTSGLVGWYPFNGNANDLSGGNNNGTVNGATLATDRNGYSNKAYSFDGVNDNIIINNSFDESSKSINVWINPFIVNSSTQIIISIDNPNLMNGANIFRTEYTSNSNKVGVTGAFSAGTYIDVNVNLNSWQMLTMVKNSTNTLFYYNGNYVGSTPSGVYHSNTGSISTILGSDRNAVYCWFNGLIDDIGIWNRALTPQEITNLYLGCNINPVIPIVTNANIGQNAQITSNVTNCQYVWESNSNNLGWTIVPSNISYSNVTTNNLSINNIQVSNHLQEFRVIATQGNCVDTSNVSTIIINDTCINTVNDTITTHITVTDTLLINVAFAGLTPPNNSNTIKVYPNPANDFVIIDNGNFAMMTGYSVKITNSLGATVFNSPINQAVFNVSSTAFGARGTYYIHILNSNNAIIDTREIVLQ